MLICAEIASFTILVHHLVLCLPGIGVLAPYLTIHMKSLGITVEETAIIFGVVPIFALFGKRTQFLLRGEKNKISLPNCF